MPLFESTTPLLCTARDLFEFLARPTNLALVTPPELNFRVTTAPERLELGARIVAQGRRFGIVTRIISEVTAFDPDERIVEEQRHGPFAKFVHTRTLTGDGAGVRLSDKILFEPPTGLLGLALSAAKIQRDLEWLYAFRAKRFKELLERPAGDQSTEMRS